VTRYLGGFGSQAKKEKIMVEPSAKTCTRKLQSNRHAPGKHKKGAE